MDQREQMVECQIAARGVRDARILDALSQVPRERFVGRRLQDFAYDDRPLPIGKEQTISQPYIVALMLECMKLQPEHKVLEVGTGSGYAAAVLSRLVNQVYTVERHKSLADRARNRLRKLGYQNVEVRFGDGTLGWPEKAPFDSIVVAAGGDTVPRALLEQLKEGARLVIPVGGSAEQELMVFRRTGQVFEEEMVTKVRFVPLLENTSTS